MRVQLNHTIIWSRNPELSATFIADILGLARPVPAGRFHVVMTDNGVALDYAATETGSVAPQHYAFQIEDADFDTVFGRIQARGLTWWADPARTRLNQLNDANGGRGCYFADPDGHVMEILTRPLVLPAA